MAKLPQDFLWGGALAAINLKVAMTKVAGLSVIDVMTAGAHGQAREITQDIEPDKYYLIIWVLILPSL